MKIHILSDLHIEFSRLQFRDVGADEADLTDDQMVVQSAALILHEEKNKEDGEEDRPAQRETGTWLDNF